LPSETNFILAKPPGNVLPASRRQGTFTAKDWLQKLREKKILVRWFSQPEVKDYLRITIGTPAEAEALIRAAKAIMR
jgi:histidinol-phosphate aminotransferase